MVHAGRLDLVNEGAGEKIVVDLFDRFAGRRIARGCTPLICDSSMRSRPCVLILGVLNASLEYTGQGALTSRGLLDALNLPADGSGPCYMTPTLTAHPEIQGPGSVACADGGPLGDWVTTGAVVVL